MANSHRLATSAVRCGYCELCVPTLCRHKLSGGVRRSVALVIEKREKQYDLVIAAATVPCRNRAQAVTKPPTLLCPRQQQCGSRPARGPRNLLVARSASPANARRWAKTNVRGGEKPPDRTV